MGGTSDEERSPMKFAAENNNDEIVEILREAIGGEIPDDVKILQLSKAMYQNDKDKFSELLSSISPELVSSTGVNHFGSVLQDAVSDNRRDFIRLMLEHGVDPTVGSDTKEETSVDIAMQYSEYPKIPLLNLFAEFIELPAEMRIIHVKLQIQHGSGGWDIFKKQLESLSVEELDAQRIRAQVHSSLHEGEVTFMQFLAYETRMFFNYSEELQLLINHGLDPRAVTEEVGYTSLEIAAIRKHRGV